MYEADILKHFSGVPVFSLSDVTQIISNRGYAKQFVSGMVKKGKIERVRKGLYSLHRDPFLASTFLLKPSYISSVSALSYYHKITQIPRDVFCFTSRPTREYFFITRINFYHTKFFFGFEKRKYNDFELPIATPEKAIIDSIGKVPLHVIEEAFDGINLKRIMEYLERIGKSCVVKRVGYLLEKNGYDVFENLREFVDNKYIPLDPLTGGKKRNRKWRLFV